MADLDRWSFVRLPALVWWRGVLVWVRLTGSVIRPESPDQARMEDVYAELARAR